MSTVSVPDLMIDVCVSFRFCSGDESSHLSLRRLFSNIRLSRTRTGSLDQLRLNPHPPVSNPSPPGNGKTSSLLKKSPSVQSLSVVRRSLISSGRPIVSVATTVDLKKQNNQDVLKSQQTNTMMKDTVSFNTQFQTLQPVTKVLNHRHQQMPGFFTGNALTGLYFRLSLVPVCFQLF